MKTRTFVILFGSVVLSVTLASCSKTIQPVVDRITGTVAVEQKKAVDRSLATVKCQELCQYEATNGNDLSSGPCLSNVIIPGWVCDLANNPRQPADNDPANQCEAFRNGTAQHFVEVDGNCNLIKVQ